MEELIGLCNRIYVMYEGAILDEVEGERKTQEVIINNLLGVNAEWAIIRKNQRNTAVE